MAKRLTAVGPAVIMMLQALSLRGCGAVDVVAAVEIAGETEECKVARGPPFLVMLNTGASGA